MASARFQMAQNDVKSISNPARVTAVGGNNGTEFYLNFPYFAPGSDWVFPFTYGFMYTVDTPTYQPVKIDASQIPAGAQVPPSTTKVAQLAAYDTAQVFNPGITINIGTTQTIAFPRAIYQVGSYNFQVPRSNAKGIICYLHAFSGAGTVSINVQDLDPAAGIPAANMSEVVSLAIAAGGDARVRVYPGLTASASVANDVTGGAPYLTAVVAGAQMEFSVGYVAVF
jgi:hypothetical protein